MSKNEHAEWRLLSLLSTRVLATREAMIRILKSGTEKKDDLLSLGQQLRTIHADIAQVFMGQQTEMHPASVLATLLNAHTDAELSLFNALHLCFEETKGSLCTSVKQAGENVDATAQKLTVFLFEFHPSLMDGFVDSLFGDTAAILETRRRYYQRLHEHIHDWVSTTKEMALAYLDGRVMDSMTITYKLIEISRNLAYLWAKIARCFVPPSITFRLGGGGGRQRHKSHH